MIPVVIEIENTADEIIESAVILCADKNGFDSRLQFRVMSPGVGIDQIPDEYDGFTVHQSFLSATDHFRAQLSTTLDTSNGQIKFLTSPYDTSAFGSSIEEFKIEKDYPIRMKYILKGVKFVIILMLDK